MFHQLPVVGVASVQKKGPLSMMRPTAARGGDFFSALVKKNTTSVIDRGPAETKYYRRILFQFEFGEAV